MRYAVDDSEFIIEYRITEHCNLDCEYCEFLHNNKSSDHPISYKDINALIDIVREKYNKPITLNIYGGEPLLHKDIAELLNNIDNTVRIEICTNLTMVIPELLNDNVSICATYHRDGIPFEDFLNNAMQVRTNIGMIPLMYTEDGYGEREYTILSSIFGDLVNISPVVLYNGDINNTPQVVEVDESDQRLQHGDFFRKSFTYNDIPVSAYDMFKNHWNMFEGYTCECVKNKLFISYVGDVYKCSMDRFFVGEPIAHITDLSAFRDMEYFDVVCPHKYCMYDVCESGNKWK